MDVEMHIVAVSYTHLTLPTTSRRQRQMCIRDRYCGMLNASYNLKLYQSQELSLD